MSLILEALRKSEAERRRGVAPTVYAELPPSAQVSRKAIPAWLWPLAGALLLAGVWLARGGDTPRPSLSTSDTVTAAPVATPSPRKELALPPVRHLSPLPAPTPAMASTRVPQALVANAPSAAPAIEPIPQPRLPQNRMPQANIPQSTTDTPPIPTAARAVAPPTSAARADDVGTLRLGDLSVEQRKALPPLKLSMHMWNDDPAQRFVILDGSRLHEGDRIGDAVVTSITADGVLLDWNGRRLKLPIR